jgi:hypothetical protein
MDARCLLRRFSSFGFLSILIYTSSDRDRIILGEYQIQVRGGQWLMVHRLTTLWLLGGHYGF